MWYKGITLVLGTRNIGSIPIILTKKIIILDEELIIYKARTLYKSEDESCDELSR